MMVNRRNLLCAGLASLAGGTLASAAAASTRRFFSSRGTPLGLQLYTLDGDLKRDFDGTLQKVAELGIEVVEIASFHGRSAKQMRQSLNAAGLRATGLHVPVASLVPQVSGLTFGNIEEITAYAGELGVTQIVLPIIQFEDGNRWGEKIDIVTLAKKGGGVLSTDTYEHFSDFLNGLGAQLRKHGLRLGYHNHNVEFAPLGKTTGMEILLAQSDPDLVTFEMDAGWIAAAGHDPVEWLRRYPGRFTQMHVKDIKRNPVPNYAFQQHPAEVGSGDLNWPEILKAAWIAGVRSFYIEQEPPFSDGPADRKSVV